MHRLYTFLSNINTRNGYIPDIHAIFVKYELGEYFVNYVSLKVFPNKHEWKRIVQDSVWNYVTGERTIRMKNSHDFKRFIGVCESEQKLEDCKKCPRAT